MRRTEHSLYVPLIRGAMYDGWLLWRVRDSDEGRQPFDIAGIAPDGRGVGVEVKIVDFSSNRVLKIERLELRAQQRHWLKTYEDLGAHAFVVCHRQGDTADDLLVIRLSPFNSDLSVVGTLTRMDTGAFVGWNALKHRGPP